MAVTREEEDHVSSLVTEDGIARHAKAHHSVITPTFKAVLAIATEAMTDAGRVLLVLTGHNRDMVSGPPDFNSIADHVIARRSDSVVEVSLQTAVRFLRLLERKEEAVNDAFRTRNDERREAIY